MKTSILQIVSFISLVLTCDAGAAVLDFNKIKKEGPGCEGMEILAVTDDGQTSTEYLVFAFAQLRSDIVGSHRNAKSFCKFALPFKVDAHKFLRFSNINITGEAEIAPHVKGGAQFEMGKPQARGPKFDVGYKASTHPVNESFSKDADPSELAFDCGESSQFTGYVESSLDSNLLYEGESSSLMIREVRVNIKQSDCP